MDNFQLNILIYKSTLYMGRKKRKSSRDISPLTPPPFRLVSPFQHFKALHLLYSFCFSGPHFKSCISGKPTFLRVWHLLEIYSLGPKSPHQFWGHVTINHTMSQPLFLLLSCQCLLIRMGQQKIVATTSDMVECVDTFFM